MTHLSVDFANIECVNSLGTNYYLLNLSHMKQARWLEMVAQKPRSPSARLPCASACNTCGKFAFGARLMQKIMQELDSQGH